MIGWPATSKRGYMNSSVIQTKGDKGCRIGLTLGKSRDSGLNLVPLEGPPTCSILNLCSSSNAFSKSYQNDSFRKGRASCLSSHWYLQRGHGEGVVEGFVLCVAEFFRWEQRGFFDRSNR